MKKVLVVLLACILLLGVGFYLLPSKMKMASSPADRSPVASIQLEKEEKMSVRQVQPSERIVEQEILISRDSYQIYGKLYAPEGYENKHLPLLIFSHGFGNTLDFVTPYAEELAKAGYLVYAFDFVGGSQASRSGGSMLEMSVFTEQADLQAVVEHFQETNYVARDQLVLLGYSQGGVVSTLVASQNPEIRGLITYNGAFVLFDDARQLFPNVTSIPEIYNHRGTDLGRVYFEKLLDYDIYAEMQQVKAESLIFQGDQDQIVPLSYAEKAAESLPYAQLKVVEGAGHIFSPSQMDTILGETQQFLEKILKN